MTEQDSSYLGPYDFSALEAFFEPRQGKRSREDNSLSLSVADIRDHVMRRSTVVTAGNVKKLLGLGCIEQTEGSGFPPRYDVTPTGESFYRRFVKASLDTAGVESYRWTGVVSPPKVVHILAIIDDMEKVVEGILDNAKHSQIVGLIIALRAILQTPEPPKAPVLSIIRDPAFANIVEVGSFLLLIATYLKT